MAEEELRQDLMEFQKTRNQLMAFSSQKLQTQAQISSISAALEELKGSNEKKVYKATGAILIQKDTEQVRGELEEEKKGLELRLGTLQKQEESSLNKLNKLKGKIEKAGKKEDTAEEEETTAE